MHTHRNRTAAVSWGAALLVLGFAALSLHAQDNPKKETSRPAPRTEHKAEHREQPSGQGERHQSSPAVSQPAPQAPRDNPPARPAESHPGGPTPHYDRPSTYQPPAGGGQPQQARPQQPTQPIRPAIVPNDPPNRNDRPREMQTNRPVQPSRPNAPPTNQPGRTFGRDNNPGGTPARSAGPPPRVFTTRGGDTIRRDEGGRVREVHMSSGAVVYHAPSGVRRVEVIRPGGRVVVASAPGHGYVQRQVVVNNVTVVKRTYIVNNVSYVRVYRPVTYGGIVLNVYTPVRYYRPSFYVYAYNPWASPVIYNWGWAGRPWYGYYGGYFTPYPVYASPTLWLTDYLVAATLEAAYQERMAASAPPSAYYAQPTGNVALTPAVKQQIADEVRRQIDQERAEGQSMNAGNSVPLFADNTQHVFVAYTSLAVNSNAGECTISEGDVLQTTGAPPQSAGTADVVVLASRGRDCPKGSRAMVPLQDLQEMHNHMRATIDRGMGDLQARQGQNGMPALPSGAAGTIDSPFASQAQPDANVGAELTEVARETDRAEQAIVAQSPDPGGAAPPTLSLGMTVDEVKAIQGEPDKIVDLGSKKIYVYKDLKITFTDGKSTDIQ